MSKKAAPPAADRGAALDRLRGTTDYEALRDCDFVIEAATENEALKVAILQRIDAVARDDAIVATNTSSISIGRLAATAKRPHAFVGMHFFNPVRGHASGRGGARAANRRRDGRCCGGARKAARQDSGRGERRSGLRRQSVAVPDAQRSGACLFAKESRRRPTSTKR